MCDIGDLELLELVKSIPKIAELGLRLGFEAAEVDGYEDENKRDRTKREGTYAMLKDWCQQPEASRARLVQILRASKIARAAKKLETGAPSKPSSASNSAKGTLLQTQPKSSQAQGGSSRTHDTPTLEADGDHSFYQITPAQPEQKYLNPEETYETWTSAFKGFAFILNNENFRSTALKNREGSSIDLRNMIHLFAELGYQVEYYSDRTSEQIFSDIDSVVEKINKDHRNQTSACFVFMSHGNSEGIFGIEAKDEADVNAVVKVEDIKNKLTTRACRRLEGKPKLVFIQACRGKADTRCADESDGPAVPSVPQNISLDAQVCHSSANNADLFIANSTSNGFISMRNTREGSWFLQAVSKVFLEHAHEADLDELMRKVHKQVITWKSEKNVHYSTHQVPASEAQGITKRFFFFPKYPPYEDTSMDCS